MPVARIPNIGRMTTSESGGGSIDRRSKPHLRELVDEMMASIRAAANTDLWSPEERARYEADMARIMEAVRERSLQRNAGPDL